MYIYILEIIFFVSAGVMVFLLTRAIPHVQEEKYEKKVWRSDGMLHKLDQQLLSKIGKMLRKVHVFVMRLDRILFKYIDAIKKQSGNGGEEKSIFTELEEKNKEEDKG